MSIVLVHPRTAAQLAQIVTDPPQALIVSGPEGSGKLFVALNWLQDTLGISSTNIRVIEPLEKSSITVAQVRDLYHATRSKQSEKQFFVLDGAGSMSIGAQNAFLKLLEEPNQAIHFVLTTHTLEDLLPTIRSRAQHIAITPVQDTALLQHLQSEHHLEPAVMQQIAFIAKGRVGLATRMASNPESLETYRGLAAKAKQLLSGTAFDRMTLLMPFSDRSQALTFLEIAANMASTLLQKATRKEDQQLWVNRIALIHDTLERLSANANLKIQLTRLALAL